MSSLFGSCRKVGYCLDINSELKDKLYTYQTRCILLYHTSYGDMVTSKMIIITIKQYKTRSRTHSIMNPNEELRPNQTLSAVIQLQLSIAHSELPSYTVIIVIWAVR